MDRSLVREYEGIIRTMKEQIAVLKSRVSRKPPEALQERDFLLKERRSEAAKLREQVNSLNERNRFMCAELTSFQLGASQVSDRSQIQEKLL